MFEILIAVCVGTALAIICFMIGGWLVFKSKAGPGEGFVRTPKGKVFSIPDEQAGDFPEEGAVVAERSKKFLAGLLGGKS